jgi:hypothetical protein
MKSRFLATFALAALAAGCSAASTDDESSTEGAVTSNTSAYTDLGPIDQHCRLIDKAGANNGDWSNWDCAGMGGYTLRAEYGDGRENVVVKTPGGTEQDLEVWSQLPAFGHLGPKAEWRGTFASPGQVKPSALIFRYFQADPETGKDDKSYLLVARLTENAACVYATVDGTQAGANEKARAEADRAGSVRCPSEQAGGQVTSAYTPLDSSDKNLYPECKEVALDKNMGYREWDCGGQGGYSTVIGEGDWTYLSVKYPGGRYTVPAASLVGHLGPKAEWRGTFVAPGKVNPFALIYRYIMQDTMDPPTYKSALVVVKLLGNQEPCVFSIVNASTTANANVVAREAAERSRIEACPKDAPELP